VKNILYQVKVQFVMVFLAQGFSNGALGPPFGATERLSGDHKQRPSLGSFAVILHNPSVTIHLVFAS